MKHKTAVILLSTVLSAVALTACEQPGQKESVSALVVEEVKVTELPVESLDEDTDGVITGNFRESVYNLLSSDHLSAESRLLMGRSTEGGEIIRYLDKNGQVLRYNVKFYGEMGRSETDYYLSGDSVYYSYLLEEYNIPMYMDGSNRWYRSLQQGMLKDGICYRYDELREEFRPSDQAEIPYQSLAELEADYDLAEEEEVFIDFSRYNILVLNGYLLGGYYDGMWINSTELYPLLPDMDNYKVYLNGTYQGIVQGESVYDPNSEQGYTGPWVHLSGPAYDYGTNLVAAYSGTRDLEIESGESLSIENETYQTALQEYLTAAGYTEAFELKHVTKVDIDSDGQDEVIVQAYYFNEEAHHESISVMFMRKMIDGKVENITILPSDPYAEADVATIRGFCDLNGDGVKEMLFSTIFTGYSTYQAYEFKDGAFAQIYMNEAYH